ncbi:MULTISPECIES: ParB/Srx family N-terminal domain-containing protein [unclassified Caballeronia]|uniref:ParB/Srx family N-terminal domain-containing protein n=1 Tax=unclassified Caballeronia TaxID=2646786 RepID=UPI00202869AF|nr:MULTISPECIES: ParB/Srx family N-terminal domain-containing protein [unclassified Caballeronia]
MKTLKIDQLRPTQLTHGLREVLKKAETYRTLKGHELEMAIAEKPVPIVYGPRGDAYAIDHHHVAAALWRADVKRVPVVLVRDFSTLSPAEFWLTLENNRWAYPYNALGQRMTFEDMREHIWTLEDDVFRSLSAAVRDAGGYEKTNVPLEEFRWADFFRHSLPQPRTDAEFAALTTKGVKLAKTKAALGLPGYQGPAA